MNFDLDFLMELMRIRSVSDDVEAVNAAQDAMERYLTARGVFCTMECTNGRKVLYAATKPGKTQDYLLNAHLDVVPAPESAFTPVIDGDILRGRGSSDCKGNAVAIAQVLVNLVGKASVGAVFTGDEEIGGSTTAYMVSIGYCARKAVLLLDCAPYSIACAQKGTATFTLTARGRGGHSSTPWEFDNPVPRLCAAVSKLQAQWPADDTSDHWCDTIATTVLSASQVANKIPDVATAKVNLRYIEPGSASKALDRIRATTGLEVSLDMDSTPVFCDQNEPVLQRLIAAMRAKWPDKNCSFYKMHGATDSRHFVSIGCPIAMIGTVGGEIHADGEWASMQSLAEYAMLIEKFVAE